jgi:hypothetical protein
LKKRTKKLRLIRTMRCHIAPPKSQSFCFFFQKEALPCYRTAPGGSCKYPGGGDICAGGGCSPPSGGGGTPAGGKGSV